MKSLLRKKGPIDNRQRPSPSPIQDTRQTSTIETPLYARFASKPGLPPQERVRPVVSGPMPLGRPNRANLDGEENWRRHEETAFLQHRPIDARQGTPPITQSASGSLPRNGQSPTNKRHQDARVIPPQASKQPFKAQTFSFSDEELSTLKPHHVALTENSNQPRGVLPSPPVSPRLSPSQKAMPINVYQSSSPSFPSVVQSYTTATESPAIATRSYGELRQQMSLPPPPTSGSMYNITKPDPAEQKPYKLSDNFFPSPNQAPYSIDPRQSPSVSPHQGAFLPPPSNGRMETTKPLPGPPPDSQLSQDKLDRRTSRTLTEDPQIRVTSSLQESIHRNMSQAIVIETIGAPFATPPQSPDKRLGTSGTRRANTRTRGRAPSFAARNPESEPAPEKMRRGSRIFATQDTESRPVGREGESPREVEQRVEQQPQVPAKPLWSGTAPDSPEHGSQLAQHRSLSHTQTYRQEQTRTSQVLASYEDEAPPTAHPALRRISKGSVIRVHASPSFLEENKPPPAKHSRKSSHGKSLPKDLSPPPAPQSVPNPTPTPETTQPSSQAQSGTGIPVPSSSWSLPDRNTSSSESLLPPIPPEKPSSYDIRGKWPHHMEHQSSPQPPVPADDIEIETRGDTHRTWETPVPVEAEPEGEYPSPSSVEDAQENVSETYLPNGSAIHESPSRTARSIDDDPIQAPAGAVQLHDGAVDLTDHHANGLVEPVSNSSLVDVELVARPRRRTLPSSSEEYSRARARRRGTWLEKSVPIDIADLAEETKPKFYPLLQHLQNAELLAELLVHLSFYEWLILWGSTSKDIRQALDSDPALCDVALECYLGTVGYARWSWPGPEPIRISLAEMHAYMRGVSVPVYVYAQSAFSVLLSPPSEEGTQLVRGMKKQTRAFNRVVLRLRAQAEADAEQGAATRRRQSIGQSPPPRQPSGPPPSWSAGAGQGQNGKHRPASRQSSRAPSPTNSAWSQWAGSQPHLPLGSTPTTGGFRSPLFRLRRAPLLRVFVPSPEGDWLSDSGVIECETELRKAGILPLLRVGDVVWDTALGDEGNVGRLVWDGRYLIDLDYTYSQIGDVPSSLPALAFPPSYFHRVIRVAGDRNPICHLDIRFWGEEIITNLQLLQDRVRTETPQGAYHTVVRWVHRSSFTIRSPPGGAPTIILPNRERRIVDPGWRGIVVVEAEGTNEGLADLQARCRGVFQPRAGDVAPPPGERERMVWRVLRERSRPGEIWIRAVNFKERLIP
ncbi:hypothetical protein BJV78DRAFT_1185167 [Lactifluus subvellereus]|nr:hypothetical protein BJV78DRAFT_1185167 [Lactifluus subvellereus]